MRFKCPHCGRAYQIDQEYIGQKFQCLECEKYFIAHGEDNHNKSPAIQPPVNQKPAMPPSNAANRHPIMQNVSQSAAMNTMCPVCLGEINPGAFKCKHCGEVLRTFSGKPPVDRVGYIIVGALLGWFGFHYLYAKQVVEFFIHIGIAVIVPTAAVAISNLIGFKELSVFFVTVFSMVFIVYTIFTVARDPNRQR